MFAMSILHGELFKSSLFIGEHELDIDEQIRAATALQTYVDEVVAGLKTLLLAQEKFRDGVVKELQEAGQAMEAPLNKLGRAFRHAQEAASQTTVGLQVHHQKLIACRSELAHTDEVAAMLQFTGVVLQADNDSECHEVDSQVLANTEKGKPLAKERNGGVQLAKLTYAAKVQQAFARSTLEACVSRRKSLVELARKALEAVAQTVPQVDETDVTGVFDMTASSNSTVSSYDCNEPWSPLSRETAASKGASSSLSLLSSWNQLLAERAKNWVRIICRGGKDESPASLNSLVYCGTLGLCSDWNGVQLCNIIVSHDCLNQSWHQKASSIFPFG